MLDSLRRNKASMIIKGALGIIILVFIFWGVGGFKAARKDIVAKVNREPISSNEFEKSYKELYQKNLELFKQNQKGEIPDYLVNIMKRQVIDNLVEKHLFLQQASRLKLLVSDEELSKEIRDMIMQANNGQFSKQLYDAILARNQITHVEFEKGVRQELLLQKFINLISSNIDITDAEVTEYYRMKNDRRDLEVFTVDQKKYEEETEEALTEEEINNFMASGGDAMQAYYSDHIVNYTKEKGKKKVVTPFEETKRAIAKTMITEERSEKLADQRAQEILNGFKGTKWGSKNPRTLIEKYQISSRNTGLRSRTELSIFQGEQAPDLIRDAFLLTPKNPYSSKVFKNGRRFMFFRLVETKLSDMTRFEKEKDQIKQELVQQRRSSYLQQWSNSLRSQASIKIYEDRL